MDIPCETITSFGIPVAKLVCPLINGSVDISYNSPFSFESKRIVSLSFLLLSKLLGTVQKHFVSVDNNMLRITTTLLGTVVANPEPRSHTFDLFCWIFMLVLPRVLYNVFLLYKTLCRLFYPKKAPFRTLIILQYIQNNMEQENNQKIYVGYTRLSDVSDQSINNQKNNIKQYAKENNLKLSKIYNEGERQSGFDNEREEYQKIKKQMYNNNIDGVIINDNRRLSRDIDEIMRLIPDFRQNDIELHVCREGRLDLSDPVRASMEIMMAASSYKEKRKDIKKSIEACKKKRERGEAFGRPPYGYKYSDDKTKWIIDPTQFDAVYSALYMRTIDKTYNQIEEVTGISTSTLSDILNKNTDRIMNTIKEHPDYEYEKVSSLE